MSCLDRRAEICCWPKWGIFFFFLHLSPLSHPQNVLIFAGLSGRLVSPRVICAGKCRVDGYYCQICMTLPTSFAADFYGATIIELCSGRWFMGAGDPGGDTLPGHAGGGGGERIKVTGSRVRSHRKPDVRDARKSRRRSFSFSAGTISLGTNLSIRLTTRMIF